MAKKYYIAYGSNLNVDQMAWRCPRADPAGIGELENWRLAFRGNRTGAYLTIVPCEGSAVPVGIWEITESDEKSLDIYEGYPTVYTKRMMKVKVESLLTGEAKEVDALVYIMREDAQAGIPFSGYVRTCREGYDAFWFAHDPLDAALREAWKEVRNGQ